MRGSKRASTAQRLRSWAQLLLTLAAISCLTAWAATLSAAVQRQHGIIANARMLLQDERAAEHKQQQQQVLHPRQLHQQRDRTRQQLLQQQQQQPADKQAREPHSRQQPVSAAAAAAAAAMLTAAAVPDQPPPVHAQHAPDAAAPTAAASSQPSSSSGWRNRDSSHSSGALPADAAAAPCAASSSTAGSNSSCAARSSSSSQDSSTISTGSTASTPPLPPSSSAAGSTHDHAQISPPRRSSQAPPPWIAHSQQHHSLTPQEVQAPHHRPAQQARRFSDPSTAPATAADSSSSGHPPAPAVHRPQLGAVLQKGRASGAPPHPRQPSRPAQFPARPPWQPQPVFVPAGADRQAQLQRSRGPVDVVYLWVNGSDPQLQQELQGLKQLQLQQERMHNTTTNSSVAGPSAASTQQQFSQQQQQQQQQPSGWRPATEDPAKQARFDAGRDELRFSLRSLEMYLPWFRHLFIVTNGQVPSWLRTSQPRVTIVPHSSIFRDTSHLPTYSSVAIQANLANIPGLSKSFILMDDDWLLTAPWNRSDLTAPDGGQHLTGSAVAAMVNAQANTYLKMIHHLDQVFAQRFGHWPRHDPSHSPHYVQLHWLRQLQEALPDLFEATSAARFRGPDHLLLAAAYQWYVARFQPGTHATLPDTHASFLAVSDATARGVLTAAIDDLRQRLLRDNGTDALALAQQHPGLLAGDYWHQTQVAVAAAAQQQGPGLTRKLSDLVVVLSRAWSKPGAKTVCLQDDMSDLYGPARALTDPTLRQFLAARYPTPSQFELPAGASNGCRRLPKTLFGQLPTSDDYAAVCDHSLLIKEL